MLKREHNSVLLQFFVSVYAVCSNFVQGRKRDSMIGCPLKPPSRTASEPRQCSWTLTNGQDDLDCRSRTAGELQEAAGGNSERCRVVDPSESTTLFLSSYSLPALQPPHWSSTGTELKVLYNIQEHSRYNTSTQPL